MIIVHVSIVLIIVKGQKTIFQTFFKITIFAIVYFFAAYQEKVYRGDEINTESQFTPENFFASQISLKNILGQQI